MYAQKKLGINEKVLMDFEPICLHYVRLCGRENAEKMGINWLHGRKAGVKLKKFDTSVFEKPYLGDEEFRNC